MTGYTPQFFNAIVQEPRQSSVLWGSHTVEVFGSFTGGELSGSLRPKAKRPHCSPLTALHTKPPNRRLHMLTTPAAQRDTCSTGEHQHPSGLLQPELPHEGHVDDR